MEKKSNNLRPIVSVIIPTYNRAKCIKRAIGSVLNQTYKNVEIIVVDDGSTDNTKEVLKTFIESKKIKYFYQKNKGPSAARNLGIKNSKGEYIAFLDSDDEWLPEKLGKQIRLFQNSKDKKLGFVGCNVIVVMETTGDLFKYKFPRYKNFFEFLLSGPFMWTPSIILTKKKIIEAVGLFDENLRFYEDWDIWIRIARKYNFDLISDYLIKYYLDLEPSWLVGLESTDYVIQKFQQYYQKFPKLYSIFFRLLGSLYIIHKGDVRKGRKLFLESMKYNRFNIRSYFYFLLSFLGSDFYRKISRFTLKYKLILRSQGR